MRQLAKRSLCTCGFQTKRSLSLLAWVSPARTPGNSCVAGTSWLYGFCSSFLPTSRTRYDPGGVNPELQAQHGPRESLARPGARRGLAEREACRGWAASRSAPDGSGSEARSPRLKSQARGSGSSPASPRASPCLQGASTVWLRSAITLSGPFLYWQTHVPLFLLGAFNRAFTPVLSGVLYPPAYWRKL